MSVRRVTIVLLALVLALPFARLLGQRKVPLPPMPTEHRLDSDAERRNRQERKHWFDQMHAAAPGTDWRAIERENGRALMALRGLIHREESPWEEIGSRNQAGRMHCMALSLEADSLYGGSSRGGIWKGSLDGEGWRPVSDNLWGGAHGVAVAAGDPEVLTRITDGGDIDYSDDAGATWQQPLGLPASFSECKRVMTDPADLSRVYLMARPIGPGKVLYRSEDSGRSYTQVYALNYARGDFWLDRIDGGDVYVLNNNKLYRSGDHGDTWVQLGTIGTMGTSGGVLTASEAGAPTFYAAIKVYGDWELHRSTDGGLSWEYRYAINDFWQTLCASITDPDLIVFAGVECWRSPNGGANFVKVNNWWDYYGDPLNKLHADFPGMDCVLLPGDTEATFYCATDGGLYHGSSTMASVTNISLSGLGVSQYYDIHTSVEDPELLLAGSQDQGYQRSEGPVRGPTWDFDQLISGDYGHLTSGDGTHDVVFSVYPGFLLIQEGSAAPVLHSGDFPAGESYSWLPPIVANPENPVEFYFCAKHLQLGHWHGGDTVTYTPSAQDFTVAGGSYLSAFSIAPSDYDRRIAVTNSGRVWYSSDHGTSWTLSPDEGPSAHYFYGTAIVHSHTDPLRAWIGGSGYSGPGVYRTDDGGASWTSQGTGLPSTLVYGLVLESPASEVLYAATESGPYRLDPDTQVWEYIGGSEAPLTTYWCVEAVPAAGVVRFGTYGRGIWDYHVLDPTSVAEGEAPPEPAIALAAYPNPFNPRTVLRYQLDGPAEPRLTLYDASGRRLRVLREGPQDAGAHEYVWDGRDGAGNELPSGVYLARIEAAGRHGSARLTLIR